MREYKWKKEKKAPWDKHGIKKMSLDIWECSVELAPNAQKEEGDIVSGGASLE